MYDNKSEMILSVYAIPNQTIQILPRNFVWEIPDEIWDEPIYIDRDQIEFSEGIITINEPGEYDISGTISFFVVNRSSEIVHGNALLRFINGDIIDKDNYTINEILQTTYIPGTIFPQQRLEIPPFPIKLTLSFNVKYILCCNDIRDGNNTFAPQYMFENFLYPDEEWPEGLSVSRDTFNVQTFMNVVKIK